MKISLRIYKQISELNSPLLKNLNHLQENNAIPIELETIYVI